MPATKDQDWSSFSIDEWAHASIFFKLSLISSAQVFRSGTTENKEVSSVKGFGFEDRFSAKSLI